MNPGRHTPDDIRRPREGGSRRASAAPVKLALIDAAERLLTHSSPSQITTTVLLREAKVARGSLYHHFGNLAHLLETAMLRSFSRDVTSNVLLLKNVVISAKTKEEFQDGLRLVTEISQSAQRRESRFTRARLIARSQHNERLASLLADEQIRLTQAITNIFETAQRKGWIRKDIPTAAAAVFIQAYTLGKVVDDLVDKPVDATDWNRLIAVFVELTLIAPDSSEQISPRKSARRTPSGR